MPAKLVQRYDGLASMVCDWESPIEIEKLCSELVCATDGCGCTTTSASRQRKHKTPPSRILRPSKKVFPDRGYPALPSDDDTEQEGAWPSHKIVSRRTQRALSFQSLTASDVVVCQHCPDVGEWSPRRSICQTIPTFGTELTAIA
ncbi:hypothetical protein IG631_05409 [Alternaria alternata]|nr:hypothetical protein IG631_05409 [Alternaria alternata]